MRARLLVVVALVAVTSCAEKPAASEEPAIRAVEEFGNKVIRDETSPARPVVSVVLTGRKPTDNKGLHSRRARDGDLKHLGSFKSLRKLELSRSEVTDAGMKALTNLENLRSLHLDGTKVTDASVSSLASLRSLENLSLWGTKLTDTGFNRLQRALPKCHIEGVGYAPGRKD